MSLPIGLQLYSVKEDAAVDFVGVLEKVAKMGYDGVEFAGYGDLTAEEMKGHLDRLGLKACGTHVGFDQIKDHLDEVIAYNKTIGNKYIVCPWATFETKEDYVNVAKFFNEVGKKISENGMKFGYHNHSHEFKTFDGEYGMDILIKETNPEYVFIELDAGWADYADVDPVEYIKNNPGRFSLIHIKDQKVNENGEKVSTVAGAGILDVKAIEAVASAQGATWLIVEQEAFEIAPLEAVKQGVDNLKRIVG